MTYDVIIIGGSYAGISAATQLGRARRKVLVIDGGERRNRFAQSSHGFLTRDGTAAAEIAAIGREQLRAYSTVRWMDGQAERAEAADDGFRVVTRAGEALAARRLVLAMGVRDELPNVPGLAERWGKSVFHCPYCHGYELDQAPLGVLAASPMSMHHAMMLPDWGPTTFFLNDAFAPDDEQRARLERRGVVIEGGAVERVVGERADVVMRDGRIFPLAGLFTLPRVSPSTPMAEQLGCEVEEGPMGTVIRVDERKTTSIAGVYACGDAARMGGSLPLAVSDGVIAGVAAHQSLIFG